MSDDLVTWLRQQLDDDERSAQAATTGPWSAATTSDGQSFVSSDTSAAPGTRVFCEVVSHDGEWTVDLARQAADADHIARHDPARVLAEVAAKRAILDLHRSIVVYPDGTAGAKYYTDDVRRCSSCDQRTATPCLTVRLLAQPYADRPGYQESWRPA